MTAPGLLDALKPYLWLALAAFLAGFLSYSALGGSRASAKAHAVWVPAAAAPASDAWNLPKHI